MNSIKVIVIFIFQSTISYGQIFNWPHVEEQSNSNMFILEVENNDTTRIEFQICNFTIDKYQFWISEKGSAQAFYLEDQVTKSKYKLIGESGKSSQSNPYTLYFDKCDTISLYFEPVVNSNNKLNLISGLKNNFWDFKGIDLSRKRQDIRKELIGKQFHFKKTLKQKINWMFSENYIFNYHTTIVELKLDGDILIDIHKVELLNPSMASINYLNYRNSKIKQANSMVGTKVWKNIAEGNLIIW